MAIVLVTQPGPTVGAYSARWSRSACLGKLAIWSQSGSYASSRYGINEISGLSDFAKQYRQDTIGTTVCTAPTGRMATYGSGNDFGVTVDLWGAFAASEWASSVAITVKSNSNGVGGGSVAVGAGIEIGGVIYDIVFSASKSATNAADSCALSPVNTWTLTAYDDGSFAWS